MKTFIGLLLVAFLGACATGPIPEYTPSPVMGAGGQVQLSGKGLVTANTNESFSPGGDGAPAASGK